MNPRSAAVVVAFYPAVVVAGWAYVSLTSTTASPRIEKTDSEKSAAAVKVIDRIAPSLTAAVNHATAPPSAALPTVAARSFELRHPSNS